MSGNITRINNNQITDAVAGNVELGIDASAKIQENSITANLLAANLVYGSNLTICGNLSVANTISTAGNIYGANVNAGNIQVSTVQQNQVVFGNAISGELCSSSNFVFDPGNTVLAVSSTTISACVINTSNISASGNIISANFTTTGAQGNIYGANIISGVTLTATGNVYGSEVVATYLHGDGSNISNIVPGTQIVNGNTNVSIAAPCSAVTMAVNAIPVFNLFAANSFGGARSSFAIGANAGQTSQGVCSIAVGTNAGQSAQGGFSVAIGQCAGQRSQGPDTVAIGVSAGQSNQGPVAVAIGGHAGISSQGAAAVAIGICAGSCNQGSAAVAIGACAGIAAQSACAIAIGTSAAGNPLTAFACNVAYCSTSITLPTGPASGTFVPGMLLTNPACSASFGTGVKVISVCTACSPIIVLNVNQPSPSQLLCIPLKGILGQQPNAIAIGSRAGAQAQGSSAIAIGQCAGADCQMSGAIAIGICTGHLSQAGCTVAIGNGAGRVLQKINAVAIGACAGAVNQGHGAIAIGHLAGCFSQSNNTIILNASCNPLNGVACQPNSFYVDPIRCATSAKGLFYNPCTKEVTYSCAASGGVGNVIVCGSSNVAVRGSNVTMQIGNTSSFKLNAAGDVAIGTNAGLTCQQICAIAIGSSAGQTSQGGSAVAIGPSAGQCKQGVCAVAVGAEAGKINQGANAVAVGWAAGFCTQGHCSIAIGTFAGCINQANNTIILNATGSPLNSISAQTCSLYVAPIRTVNCASANVLYYDTVSKEITSGPLSSSYGDANVEVLLSSGTVTTDIITTGNVSAGGNITAANYITTGTQGNIYGANVISGITLSASGNVYGTNIVGSYLYGCGANITNINANNIIGAYGNSNVEVLLSSGTVSNNIITTADVSAGGNVDGTNLNLANGGGLTSCGPFTVLTPNTSQPCSTGIYVGCGSCGIQLYGAGNTNVLVYAGAAQWTFDFTGQFAAPGNILGYGNILATNGSSISTAGNVYGANIIGSYLYGDGSNITNLGNLSVTSLVNGTSNVVVANSGNITITAVNSANAWTFDNAGNLTSNNCSSFLNSAFINPTRGLFYKPTGPGPANVQTGAILFSDSFGSGFITGNPNFTISPSGIVSIPCACIGSTCIHGTVNINCSHDLYMNGGMICASFSNIYGGNMLSNNYFYANGSPINTSIVNGTSNVTIATACGPIAIGVGGSNVFVLCTVDSTFTGNLNPVANATYSLGNVTNQWKELHVSNTTIYIGCVPLSTTNNELTFNGNPVITANATGTSTTTGNISVIGSVAASYLYGCGANITGITGGCYSNADVAAYLDSGTVTTDILTTGTVSASGGLHTTNINIDAQGAGNTYYIAANYTCSANTVITAGNIVTTSVPADQLKLYGQAQDPANIGYPVTFFDDSFAITGYQFGGIQSDHSLIATGGNINIVAGLTGCLSNTAYNEAWKFDYTGNLTLPRGGVVYETNISGNTIALAPSGGTSADQQLLVYPGDADNSLHLTSGNLYNTELFLGNDDLYVRLANTGDIVINTNDNGGNTAQWLFDARSAITLPSGDASYIQSADNREQIYFNQSANSFNIITNATYEFVFGGDGTVVFGGGYIFPNTQGTTGQVLVYNPSGSGDHDLEWQDQSVSNVANGTSNVSIPVLNGNVVINANGTNNWTFDTTGNLTLPNNTFAVNYANGTPVSISGGCGSYSNSDVATFLADFGSNNISTTGSITTGGVAVGANILIGGGAPYGFDAYLFANANASLWTLSAGTTGVASFGWLENFPPTPGNAAVISFNSPNSPGNVVIDAGYEGSFSSWTFDTAGNLTVPGDIIMPAGNALILDATTSNAYIGQGMGLQIAGEGGINFNINDGAGNITNAGFDTNANLYTSGSITATGNVYANAFYGDGGYLSNITVSGGTEIFNGNSFVTIPVTDGNVTVNANAASWLFDTTGNLNLPGNVNFPTGAAVTSSVPGSILPNVPGIGNVVGFTNGIDGNGWPNYFVLDSNGNLHIGENTGATSGAIVWDGGGSQLYESEAGVITLSPWNGQFIVAAQCGPALLNVDGFINTSAVSVYGNVVAAAYAINGSNTFLASNGNGAWSGTVGNSTDTVGFFNISATGSQLVTFASSAGQMSLQTDGSLFLGDGLGASPFGLDATSAGYVVAQGGIYSNGAIIGSQLGNAATYLYGCGANITGISGGYANANVTTLLASGAVTTDILTTGNVSAGGNITAANYITTGTQGNIYGANVIGATTLSATGNVYGTNIVGSYLYGCGANITGIPSLTGATTGCGACQNTVLGVGAGGSHCSVVLGHNATTFNGGGTGGEVIIGAGATGTYGGGCSVVIGKGATLSAGATQSVIIGACSTSASQLGIAIGFRAHSCAASGIAIGLCTTAAHAGFYVAPVRCATTAGGSPVVVGYCSGTREFVYGLSTGGGCYGNANVAAYLDSGTVSTDIITTGNVSGANIVGSYLYGCGSNVTGITTSNITGLAAVATSGAYGCLSGAPTCLNSFSNGPGYITSGDIPTCLSAFSNGPGYYTSCTSIPTTQITGLAAVATSGAYSCLSGSPTCVGFFANGPGYYTTGTSIPTTQITGLATVATSGCYGSLNNLPPPPTLDSVTGAGSTTTNDISVGALAASTGTFDAITNNNLGSGQIVFGNVANVGIQCNSATLTTDGNNVSAGGSITAANFYTAGSGGNITGANIISATTFTATGDVYGCNVFGSYLHGCGANITGLPTNTIIANGASNITIPTSCGTLNFNATGVKVGLLDASRVAFGASAGLTNQQTGAIAIGQNAGAICQQSSTVAIGACAGVTNQHSCSIIISALGCAPLNASNPGLYIQPLRCAGAAGGSPQIMGYCNTSKEIVFGVSGATYGNADVETLLASGTVTTDILTTGNVSATGNVTATTIATVGAPGNITGANIISAVTLTASGNIYGCAVFTNNIINASTGNINITGNLLPSSNNFNLGLPTVPWQNAYFGSQSITILDTVSGNLANAVTIENSSGDISMGTAAFTIGALGNNTPVFTIAALSGQIYSNAETIIQNATNSANTTSGSLQTAGGAGIAMDLYVGGNVSIGDVGEDGNIIVDGTTFDSQFTINAIGGNVPAQFILHRHSTTQEPVFAGARSNTDDSTESPVTNGMPLLSIYGAGWTDPDYQLFSAIQLSVDDNGNITGNTSTPGKIVFYTSSDGSTSNLNTALTIRNDQSAEFNGNVTIDQNLVINPVSYSSLYAVNGARAFVNDSNLAAAGNYGSQISGGGGNTTPVWSDGTNWYIG